MRHLRIAIIVPIGPGHQDYTQPPEAICVDDSKGALGRSKARNIGMRRAAEADWFFFLDADDELAPNAKDEMLKAISESPGKKAIFGSIAGWTETGGPIRRNAYPKTWEELVSTDPREGLLSISGLFSAPEALEVGFNEDLDTTETMEFSLAFAAKHDWVKSRRVFSLSHCDRASAGGPRGYTSIDWHGEMRPLLRWWKKRGRKPLNDRRGEYWK
jgi:glycosyltransferase involved in cell wall biosynthesis